MTDSLGEFMLKAKDCNRIFDTFHEMCMLNCLGMYWNAKLVQDILNLTGIHGL